MEVVTTTAMTQMEATHVPVIMAMSLMVMDILVKVGESWWVEMYVLNTLKATGCEMLKSKLKMKWTLEIFSIYTNMIAW